MTISAPPRERATPIRMLTNALRGALIGMAELLPGISGGTVALVLGVYERLLQNLSYLGAAVRQLVTGPDRRASFAENMRRIEWGFVLPMLLGMGIMVLAVAGFVESLVSAEPVASRALFFGLVAASLIVPWRLALRAGSGGRSDVIVFALAAGASFWLVGFAGAGVITDPPLVLVFAVAAVAVCALVVPGVSGSFFLLAVGLYAPTLQAVASRDLGYLAVFALGALVGLATIVRALRWLLAHHSAGHDGPDAGFAARALAVADLGRRRCLGRRHPVGTHRRPLGAGAARARRGRRRHRADHRGCPDLGA
jgi:putative membrane protein